MRTVSSPHEDATVSSPHEGLGGCQGTRSGMSGWLKAGGHTPARSVTHCQRHEITLKIKLTAEAMHCPEWEPGPDKWM